MHLLRRLEANTPIALRLGLSVVIPILAAAILAASVIGGLWQTAARMDHLRSLAQFSMRVGDLVHELQKERGMSAVFLGSNGQQFAVELPQQRGTTDTRLATVRDAVRNLTLTAYSAEMRAIIEAGLATTQQLDARRQDISAKRIAGPDSFKFFTGLIGRLLAVPREAVKTSNEPAVTANLLAYSNYLSAKERAGQERAIGATGFTGGQFTAAQHNAFLGLLADQRAFLEAFDTYATPEQRAFAQQTVG